jgi:hypothetical protein
MEKAPEGFVYAAKNQQAFDFLYYHYYGKSASNYSFIPRPGKWLNKSSKVVDFIKFSSNFAAYFWAYCGFYLYIYLKFISKLLCFKIQIKNNAIVAYAICEHSVRTILKTHHDLSDVIWLMPFKSKIEDEAYTELKISINEPSQFLSLREKFSVLKISIKTHKLIVMNHGVALSWQTYTVFEWMMQYAATLNIHPNKILIAEHHDRWAVLADVYCEYSACQGEQCLIHLFQHGKEHDEVYKKLSAIYSSDGLPYKIKYVSKLFVYDKKQAILFLEEIIDNKSINIQPIEIIFVKQSIKLKSLSKKGILFVGHSFCEVFQTELCQKLKFLSDYVFYYKPHPTSKPSESVKNQDWLIITDKNFFPRVDFLISYPSTLVDEYLSEDIRSVLHPLNAKIEDLEGFVDEIKKMVKIC